MHPQVFKWMSHPAIKLVLVAVPAPALGAEVSPSFAELDGVAEGLGLRALAVDVDWSWSWLGLVVLVVALLAADRFRPRKHKD